MGMNESPQDKEEKHDPDFVDTISAQPQSSGLDKSIGPYRLLQKIGEGGMGTVFAAEQTDPVRRKVAIKIIKPGIGNKDVLARFESERQALALMSHPNIAKIFDAGSTDDGEPYFVMEFVNGVPIVDFCHKSNLGIQSRIELFKDVCDAIHHAHQKGVMHRDIKSSNVLIEVVDDKPSVKVIDFGLAKAVGQQLTEKTLFTELGQVVGTLEYMSPEQANLNSQDIDTRTDIYSLGVLLYELLTGSTPLDKSRIKQSALDQILRMIREEEPELPSTRLSRYSSSPVSSNKSSGDDPARDSQLNPLSSAADNRRLRGELDWIVMKTLEKDRVLRYDSASALAADLQNFLAGDPVQARPYSFFYRFKKSLAKHRHLYLSGAVVVIALLLGIVGTTVGMYRALKAESTTRKQYKEIESQKKELDAQFIKIKAANERANRHVAELRDILQQFSKNTQTEIIAQNSKLNDYREKTLLAILNHFQQLSNDYPSNNELKFEMGKAFYVLGFFYNSIHSAKKSQQYYESAISAFEELLTTDYQYESVTMQLGMAYQNMAGVRNQRGLPNDTQLNKANEIWTELAKHNPNEMVYRRNQVMVRSQVASRERFQGQLDIAIQIEESNKNQLLELVKLQPTNSEFQFLLSSVYGRLASWEIDRKNPEAAIKYATLSLEQTPRNRSELETEMHRANMLNLWSMALKQKGNPEAALKKRKEAHALARKLHRSASRFDVRPTSAWIAFEQWLGF